MLFSRLGEHGAIWFAIAAAGWLLDREWRGDYTRAARAVALTYGVNQLVKLGIGRKRPRPIEGRPPLTEPLSDLSYPSAHAATSAAGARTLSVVLPAAPLYALATAMAASRLHLRVHHPTDTLAGAALGLAIAQLARR